MVQPLDLKREVMGCQQSQVAPQAWMSNMNMSSYSSYYLKVILKTT